jgi:uncharacterized protein YraI
MNRVVLTNRFPRLAPAPGQRFPPFTLAGCNGGETTMAQQAKTWIDLAPLGFNGWEATRAYLTTTGTSSRESSTHRYIRPTGSILAQVLVEAENITELWGTTCRAIESIEGAHGPALQKDA